MIYEPECPRCGEGQGALYLCEGEECETIMCDDCMSRLEFQTGVCRTCRRGTVKRHGRKARERRLK